MTFESSLLKDFCVLVGHLITLVYPLYGSIVAVASNSNVSIQVWLMYWVLFALITVLDHTVANILEWIPIWPYAKVMITCWLVLPCSSGAAYVYVHFLRPCLAVIPQNFSVWFILRVDGFILRRSDAFLDVAARYIQENGTEALEKLIAKVGVPNLETADAELLQPPSPKKAMKKWSCPLCFVSTSCQANLKQHLNGRKHNDKELKGKEMALENKDVSAKMLHITNRVDVVKDSNQVRGIYCSNRCRNPPVRFCSWEKPSLGWIKLNTDGSIDPTNAGFGGLLRDHMGSPICAFVSKAARDGICLLELWAIWRGLVLARGQGIKAIWVESDSMSVVKSIKREQPYSQKAGSCLKHIWDLLKEFEKYKISHTFREANRAADHLAKMNIDKNDVVFGPIDFPRPLCKIIEDDAEGKKYPRVQY